MSEKIESKVEVEFTIYGVGVCPKCKTAKLMCDQKGYKVNYLTMDTGQGGDFTKKELLKAMGVKIPKGKTEDDFRLSAPQIFVGDTLIGGLEQFQDYIRNNA